MAVQVPQPLNRAATPQEPSVGRIESQPIDVMSGYNVQNQAAEKLAGGVAETFQRAELAVADTTASAAANKLHQTHETLLNGPDGFKSQKGDPGPAYEKYQKSIAEARQGIVDEYSDASDLTKKAIQAKLNEVDRTFYDRGVTAFGDKRISYSKGVDDSNVYFQKSNMVDATAHLDVHDPNTTAPLDTAMDNIRNTRLKGGLKNGTVKEVLDPQGTIDPLTNRVKVVGYNLDPIVHMQIAKDISDGLYKTIDNLNASGDVEGARFLAQKYADQIDPVNKTKIEKETHKAGQDVQALNIVNGISNLSSADAIKKLDAISDPEIQKKAYAEYHTRLAQQKAIVADSSKLNYDTLATYVSGKQNSDQPFIDLNHMKNDPVYKRMIKNVTDEKQLKAIEHIVTQPEESNTQVKSEMYKALADTGLANLPYTSFLQNTAGLNKKDRDMFEGYWRKANAKTPAEELTMIKYMNTQLAKEARGSGLIGEKSFDQYSKRDQNKLNAYSDELNSYMESGKIPKNLSFPDQTKLVREFITSKVKDQAFTPPEFKSYNFNGSTVKPPPKEPDTAGVGGVPPNKVDLQSLQKASLDFKKATGRWPKQGTTELMDFIKNGNK